MIITGPGNATVSPPPPPTVAQVVVMSVHFDLITHQYTITYGGGMAGQVRVIGGATPAPMGASLAAHAQRMIEIDQGWQPLSTTIVIP